ncbi:MOSC domain-containing protein [Pseudomassariella vexata]|uniref:MOSC domain-domain-containing protein n=1 Tax=Pseudomassariella vexata TaxID=1141098 RepID=A0A1Y2DUN6_9PEZI|nr:MOSC domain-containing protein [Pseudomassariella vexata]ORY62968.1 MOSC domain-domain-containing protein [Pseudomassariella vexata]
MKITRLYVYPIKALRPMSVQSAQLQQRGLENDRRFMLCKVQEDGSLKSMQTVYFPECTLCHQEIIGDEILVTYHKPEPPLIAPTLEQSTTLRVPLKPAVEGLEPVVIKLYGSTTRAYRMGQPHDGWFTSCLGYETALVYIGDGKRKVLFSPRSTTKTTGQNREMNKGWLSSMASYVTGSQGEQEPADDWLHFNECAPFLITTEASLDDVSSRLPEGESMDMMRFRPNVVVDGIDKWDEDWWSELHIGDNKRKLQVTENCGRCMSINIDYDKGRTADGEAGNVLKKLMADRRVDAGNKWSPVFGRYAFLVAGDAEDGNATTTTLVANVAVGDEVTVTRRSDERSVWSWPKQS